MSNLVITTTANTIAFDFGTLNVGNIKKTKFNIPCVLIEECDTFVKIYIIGHSSYELGLETAGTIIKVDEIDSVEPTTISHLYNLLSAVLG